MGKTPEEKEAIRVQKEKETAALRRADFISHKEAELARLTAFACGRRTIYYIFVFALFTLSIASFIVGGLCFMEAKTINLGIGMLAAGGVLLLFGILYALAIHRGRVHAAALLPVLSRQIELIHYEERHPDEKPETKKARLEKEAKFFLACYENKRLNKREYERLLLECGIPLPEPESKEKDSEPESK